MIVIVQVPRHQFYIYDIFSITTDLMLAFTSAFETYQIFIGTEEERELFREKGQQHRVEIYIYTQSIQHSCILPLYPQKRRLQSPLFVEKISPSVGGTCFF